MTDVRGALADRLQVLAEDARKESHHSEAQELEYQAAWLRTRPTDLGGDAPPDELGVENERHVRFAGVVWEGYGSFLADESNPYSDCCYRPNATLPYTKEGITKALTLLLDIGEGRASCAFIDSRAIPPEAVETMKDALEKLDGFLDIPEYKLPTDKDQNESVGSTYAG